MKRPAALRTIAAFCIAFAAHGVIYYIVIQQPAPPSVLTASPAMETVFLDPPPDPPSKLEPPHLVDIVGALNIQAPDISLPDPSAIIIPIERPVDLPGPQAVSQRGNGSASVVDIYSAHAGVTPPRADQSNFIRGFYVKAPVLGSTAFSSTTLRVDIWFESDGRVTKAQLERSSGSDWLDSLVERNAMTWLLQPGAQSGVPKGMRTTVAISVESIGSLIRIRWLPGVNSVSLQPS